MGMPKQEGGQVEVSWWYLGLPKQFPRSSARAGLGRTPDASWPYVSCANQRQEFDQVLPMQAAWACPTGIAHSEPDRGPRGQYLLDSIHEGADNQCSASASSLGPSSEGTIDP